MNKYDLCAGSSEVLGFIDRFYESFVGDREHLRQLYRSGYCWHFAHMLRDTFNRGTVCLAAPFSHMVWVDDNGAPYDVEGTYVGDACLFIPESYLGEYLDSFKHIPGRDSTEDVDTAIKIIKSYTADTNAPIEYVEYCIKVLQDCNSVR